MLDEMALSMTEKTFGNKSIKSLSRSSALESYIDALSTARKHLLDKRIFVFVLTSSSTNGNDSDNRKRNQDDDIDDGFSQKQTLARKQQGRGKVIGLPVGSSVSDALVEICARCVLSVPKSFDASDFDVCLNGEVADLHDCLGNGDILVVPSLDSRILKFLM